MNRVIHFEIAADDPKRAAKFYGGVFGWKVDKWNGPMDYWLVDTGKKDPGINGGIMKREGPARENTVTSYINTIEVPSFDSFAKKIAKSGGLMITKKMAVPGLGWFAYFKDTEGNMFGIMENDKAAK